MWTDYRTRTKDESGLALVFALFAVLVLSGLVTLLVSRAINESRFSAVSRDFEGAVHVAEAGADELIRLLNDEDETSPVITDDNLGSEHVVDPSWTDQQVRDWAIARALEDTGDLVALENGEAYGIRPRNTLGEVEDWVIGVGFVPAHDAPNARIRVVKLRVNRQFYTPRHALLTGGDLKFGGNAAILAPDCGLDPEKCVADVHVNGDLDVTGTSHTVQGKLTVEGTISGSPSTTGGATTGAPSQIVPEVKARDFYDRTSKDFNPDPIDPTKTVQWYDLCPGGVVRAHVPDASPCTGSDLATPLTSFRGWSWKSGAWEGKNVEDGIYYVYHADATVQSTVPGERAISVLVEENPVAKGSSGSLSLNGNPTLGAGLSNVLFIADNDVKLKGNAGAGSQRLSGFIYAGELIDASGSVELVGALIENGKCDGGSPATGFIDDHGLVKCSTHGINGSLSLSFNSNLKLDLAGIVTIEYWNEL